MFVQLSPPQKQLPWTASPLIQAPLYPKIETILKRTSQWLTPSFTTTAPKPSFLAQPTPPVIYRNNLKNQFPAASAFPQNFDPHPRPAHQQWSFPPNRNLETPSYQIPSSSDRFGILKQPPLAVTQQSPTTKFLAFYQGAAENPQKRTLDDILAFDDTQLEAGHDYIQWLFINETPSKFNREAPLLNNDIIRAFKEDKTFKTNLIRSFERMLKFYGLRWQENSKTIVRAKNFEDRAKVWLTIGNHNFARITRILLCLNALGEENRAIAFYTILQDIATKDPKYRNIVDTSSLQYWKAAAAPH